MNQTQTAHSLLEDSLTSLTQAQAPADRTRAMGRLFEGLQDLRSTLAPQDWQAFLTRATEHPVLEVLHEDPMTRRSFHKPRGYAGDAVLLDYIYEAKGISEASPTGIAVNHYAVGRPAACAVRHRRDWLAFQIDRACDRRVARDGRGARVLSVACGHLREAELSIAARTGALTELVGLDSDARSLEEVQRTGLQGVQPVELSIGRLLARGERLGQFDLVYSAGLYDYLERPLAQKLTAHLFRMLEPGGRLIVSNFLNTIADAGYMETFMGWSLLLRDLDEVRDFAGTIPAADLSFCRVHADPFQAIGYLELGKAPEPA